jgi:solute carrier family 25 (adenine nucleotide translocator) protein 4/5/6/31
MSQKVNTESLTHKAMHFSLDFISGGTAGVIAKTASAPIERVKLLLQTQGTNERITKPYKGIADCFQRIWTEEGFLAYWRGNGANVIRYFPTQALNFSIKDSLQGRFGHIDRHQTPYKFVLKNLLSGGIAGSLTLLIVYPLDFARTRLGVDVAKNQSQRQFKGIGDCVSTTYKADGFKGLYRGIGPAVIGIFLYRGLYFGVYDSGKPMVLKDKDLFIKKFLFAQCCVIFSETISYPTDTVKRMLMLQSARKDVMYNGVVDCCTKVWQKDGIKGFWRGNVSNIMRSAGSSLCLVLYDEMKKHRHKVL